MVATYVIAQSAGASIPTNDFAQEEELGNEMTALLRT
jgi:hypothetical protein